MAQTMWEAWNSAIEDTIALGQYEPLKKHVDDLPLDWRGGWAYDDSDGTWLRNYHCPDTLGTEYILLSEYPLITEENNTATASDDDERN